MTDEAETTESLASGAYDGRKSGIRARVERGVEVRVRPVRRRTRRDEDKLRMVRETLEPGAVVQAVAGRNGVSTGQLYTWRKEMPAAAVTGFVPVEVVPEAPRIAEMPKAAASEPPGTMEVAFPSGTTVRISGAVDMEVLRGVLAELGGR